MSKFHEIFCTCYLWAVALGRSCSDESAVSCVFLVLRMTSCFHIMELVGQSQRRRVFSRVRQVAAAGEKLLSTIAGLLAN